MIIMGCIASKKTENRNIELNEVAKENTDKIGLTKRQRFDSKIIEATFGISNVKV